MVRQVQYPLEPIIINFRLAFPNLIWTTIVYHLLFVILVIRISALAARTVLDKRWKGVIASQRLFLHGLLLISVILRLTWLHYFSLLQMWFTRVALADFNNLLNRMAMLFVFCAFHFHVARYIKVNIITINPRRKKAIVAITYMYCYGSALGVLAVQLVISLYFILSSSIPNEGHFLFESNLILLLVYWYVVAAVFSLFSLQHSLRLTRAVWRSQVSRKRKAGLLLAKVGAAATKILLFDVSILMRVFAFSWRPLMGTYMPSFTYPLLFYTLPDAMMIMGLVHAFWSSTHRKKPGHGNTV